MSDNPTKRQGTQAAKLAAMTPIQLQTERWLTARRRKGELTTKSVQSMRSRLTTFTHLYGDTPVRDMSPRHIARWQEQIGRLSPATRAAYLSTIRQFVAWLLERKEVLSDPMRGAAAVRRPRSVPRALDPQAVAAILAVCEDERDRLIVWLMVGLGLRACEVASACWEDYSETHQTLTVTGKAGHQRVLPVPAEVRWAINAASAGRRGRFGTFVVSKTTGARLLPSTVVARAGRLMRDAGVKGRPWDGVAGHALRHTCASDVLDTCNDLRVVQALLGHSSLRSTEVYLRRASLDSMRVAMAGRQYGATPLDAA